ncbi:MULTISPECIES: VOC family protein [unclassified Frankia]|uniref:VOC family protein n=1 Tax=unclassified Frankia TaxID=2632575 RepID=UPI001EF60498|nr:MULTISPECIES: VOC family protein [unclassified Frankia]
MVGVARLAAISFDCSEPHALARFYAELTGGAIAFSSEDFVAVKGPTVWITAQRVPDHRPPTWPTGATPQQAHMEFAVEDLEAAQAQAIALGARPADEQPSPDRWRVLLDPAGHPFCLTTLVPSA